MLDVVEVAGDTKTEREVGLPGPGPAGHRGGPGHPVPAVAGHGGRVVDPGDLRVVDHQARTVPGLTVRRSRPPVSSLTPELAPGVGQPEALPTHHLDGRPLRPVVLPALHHHHPGHGVQPGALTARTPLDTRQSLLCLVHRPLLQPPAAGRLEYKKRNLLSSSALKFMLSNKTQNWPL